MTSAELDIQYHRKKGKKCQRQAAEASGERLSANRVEQEMLGRESLVGVMYSRDEQTLRKAR